MAQTRRHHVRRQAAGLSMLIAVVGTLGACTSPRPAEPATTVQATGTSDSGMVHGDHTPKYGGVVLMNGDLHFEVVLKPSGDCRVYFSDAARNELPAAVASDVTIAVTPKAGAPQLVRLEIDENGESWVGKGEAIPEETDGVARIAYSFQNDRYWIDLPLRLPDPTVLDPHKKPTGPATKDGPRPASSIRR